MIVQEGKADVALGRNQDTYLLKKYGISNIKPIFSFLDRPITVGATIRADWPEMVGILSKGISALGEDRINNILSKWIELPALTKTFTLTEQEKAWLADHRDMRLGVDPAWPPFEFLDATKNYSGIASDYVGRLNELMQINMAPVPELSWSEVMRKARKGEIDVLACIAQTAERSEFLLFSEPYMSFPMVILTREDAPFINSVDDFESGRVAIIKDYLTQELLERDYPDRQFYLANNLEEALQAVSKKKVDAFVGNLASITYTTKKLGLTNLKVAMTTPYKYELGFAVRKDWPELVDILNKSLSSISEVEKTSLHNRWINVLIEREIDWAPVFQIVGIIALVGGFILIIILRWNRTLSREVSERKRMEEALRESRATARGLLDATQESLLLLDKEGTIIAVNQTAARRNQRPPEELIGKNRFDILPGNILESRKAHFEKVLQTGNPEDFEDVRDGMVFHHIYYPVQDKTGAIIGVAIFAQDISERKRAEEAIRESQERLSTILKTTAQGFWLVDKDDNILDVNKATCELIDLPREEIIGKNFWDFLDEENREIVREQNRIRKKGKQSIYELSLLRPDGTLIPCLNNAAPLFDKDGNVAGSFGMTTNIAERKQMEEELRQNVDELERFSKVAFGREIKMIQLKQEVNELMNQVGKVEKYKIVK
jgi:PAS domain S-box-containing protein